MKLAKECRRILASGARCHALAVTGTPYCYFHQAVRSFDQENRTRHRSIVVPKIEDRAAIHITLMSVLDAIGSGKMDPVRGRIYLNGLKLAMNNLGANNNQLASTESVTNPVCPDGGEFLAPDDDEALDPLPTNELICSEPISLPLPNLAEEPNANPDPSSGPSLPEDNEQTFDTMKGTGFSPYINPNPSSGASAPEGNDTQQNEQTFDTMKGTGFSPYINPNPSSGASAPEGNDTQQNNQTSDTMKGTGFSPYINPNPSSGASAPEGNDTQQNNQTSDTMKGTGFSPYINPNPSSGALAPEGNDTQQNNQTSDTMKGTGFSPYINPNPSSGASAPEGNDTQQNNQTSDTMKGTGFSPYINPNPSSGASAPEGNDTQQNNQTFDISAAAEPDTPLPAYGAHEWQFTEPEPSDDELRQQKYIARTVRYLARDLNAVYPFRTPEDRRALSAQLHAEYFTRFVAHTPDPLPCTVASRYLASLLS